MLLYFWFSMGGLTLRILRYIFVLFSIFDIFTCRFNRMCLFCRLSLVILLVGIHDCIHSGKCSYPNYLVKFDRTCNRLILFI